MEISSSAEVIKYDFGSIKESVLEGRIRMSKVSKNGQSTSSIRGLKDSYATVILITTDD